MLIPFDEALEVHQQAEGYTSHQVWDFESTRPEQYPLLLHYPYFQLYRKQVVKQADLVLALHVRGDFFTDEQKARNFAYYEPMTVRDSSLSACTQAVVAAEVGHLDLAHRYWREAALMDLDDLEHNTRDGVHIAAVAGAWIATVAGFGGLRDHDGRLSFKPQLPDALPRIAFRMTWRGTRLKLTIEPGRADCMTCSTATPLQISHHGEEFTVEHREESARSRRRRSSTRRHQPPGREPPLD